MPDLTQRTSWRAARFGSQVGFLILYYSCHTGYKATKATNICIMYYSVALKLVRSRFCISASNQCKQPNPQITMPFRPSHFGFHWFPNLLVTILYIYDTMISRRR